MEDYQKRVIAEQKELDSKIVKLDAFVSSYQYSVLTKPERDMMRRQRVAMVNYSNVLGERIRLF